MSCSGEVDAGSESGCGGGDDLISIRPGILAELKRAKYGVAGHATVDLCHWTKKSFRNDGDCYKHKFYGIATHRCMEFSPAGMLCQNRCVYCWRPMEFYEASAMDPAGALGPKEVVERLMEERRRLVMGHYGDARADRAKLDDSLMPTHYAISLSGEPTMYPRLPELVRHLRGLPATRSIFLVTNGQEPAMLQRLADEDALPTQLYLSTNAADRGTFERINRPRYADSWERWGESLGMLEGLRTRTVLRITLIRGYNTGPGAAEAFGRMAAAASPHFVEAKSYMHVGRSINRLDRDRMLSHDEVRRFAGGMAAASGGLLEEADESKASRIVLLANARRRIPREISAPAPAPAPAPAVTAAARR